ATNTLNTSQTTRPGWLCVRREKKFDHAIEPAYAFVTLILSWQTMTKMPMRMSAKVGELTVSLKASRYISVGSSAWAAGIPWRKARNAKNEPASNLKAPRKTHPGPVPTTASHHPKRLCLVRFGRKRK